MKNLPSHGMKKPAPNSQDWNRAGYVPPGGIEDGSRRANFVDAATLGVGTKPTASQRFGDSNGLQKLPAGGRQSQTILMAVAQDNQGRITQRPEGSLFAPMTGSVCNPSSRNFIPNIRHSIDPNGD